MKNIILKTIGEIKMKKQILKAIGGASLVILLLAVFAQVWVSAQENENVLLQSGNGGNEQGLVGSWDVTVTARDCQSGTPLFSFLAVQTYHQGGTMQASNLGAPGIVRLESHGVWEHKKGRQYSVAFRVLKYNPDGTFAGKDVIRDVISLALNGNTYTSNGYVEILDPNGNLILRGCATTTATRFE
jgi:hypothetical protein